MRQRIRLVWTRREKNLVPEYLVHLSKILFFVFVRSR